MVDVLSVRGLTLTFGGIKALDDVSLSVPEGSIVGLIGPNGAGKTSMLNCICGFYRPTQGSIELDGASVLGIRPHVVANRGLGRTFQHIELFKSLTLIDNVVAGMHAHGRPGFVSEAFSLPGARRKLASQRRTAFELLKTLGLAGFAQAYARSLPLGVQKRAGIARAIAGQPRVLLLDEPAGGLNASEKRGLADYIAALNRDLKLTMLLIEHDMDMVMRLCHSITVLDFGKCIASGTPEAVRSNPAVITAYLGVSVTAKEEPRNPPPLDL